MTPSSGSSPHLAEANIRLETASLMSFGQSLIFGK